MEKKFLIQSRFYAKPPDNSDFPVGYFLSYMFLCTCVVFVNVCRGKDWECVWMLKLALRCLSPSLHTLVFKDKVSH